MHSFAKDVYMQRILHNSSLTVPFSLNFPLLACMLDCWLTQSHH
jgi:hypothetical protein